MPPLIYQTYESALRRVELLKNRGYWPGIIGPDRDRLWRLTFDPGPLD